MTLMTLMTPLIIAVKDFWLLKKMYIFSVERNMENGAQGSGNLFLGLQKFTPCPERKK